VTTRLLIVFVLLISACAGEPTACEIVADDGIALLQDLIDDLESAASTEQALIDEFDARAVDLNNQADAAGCSSEEMAELLEDRAGDLDASTDEGRAFIDLIRAGVVFPE
jgi:hypothetical protein